jgi:transposase-like protein
MGDSAMKEKNVKKEARYFSPEFKKEIVAKLANGEATLAELVSQHNLRANMICRWRRELRDTELDSAVSKAPRIEHSGVDPKYVRHLEEKLREANEKLGELYVVVEGLKKIQNPKFTKNVNSLIVSGLSLAQSKGRVR